MTRIPIGGDSLVGELWKSCHQQLKTAHGLKTKAHNQTANKKTLKGHVIASDLFYHIET